MQGCKIIIYFFSTFYYTTESTPWVSNAGGLYCATQLSKLVLNISNIHYYTFSYENRNFYFDMEMYNKCIVFLYIF